MSKINVIGASCIDLLIKNIDKESLFTSKKSKVESITTFFGGDALNESVVLNRFNDDVRLVTVIGNDYNGKQIIEFLDKKNIRYNSNIIKENIETYTSLVFIDDDGQRYFAGTENGSVKLLDIDDIVVDEDCEYVSYASLFISRLMNKDKYETLFKSLKERNKTLFVDCSSPKNNEKYYDLTYLRHVDYFLLNEDEARALTDSDDLFEAEKLLYSTGVKNVIIKYGSKGCIYKSELYKSYPIDKVIDTTGAGDSFVAGFIHGMSNNMSVDESLDIALKCGRDACEYVGATSWCNI